MSHPSPGCCPKPSEQKGSFFLQRIRGSGKLYRHAYRYILPLEDIPCCYCEPLSLREVQVNASPIWHKLPCRQQHNYIIQVQIPLQLTLCDANQRIFQTSSFITEQVPIHLQCPTDEIWRYKFDLDTAVRLCGCCNSCGCSECGAQLDVIIEAYLLSSCTVASSCPLPEPCPTKPWYPNPCHNR